MIKLLIGFMWAAIACTKFAELGFYVLIVAIGMWAMCHGWEEGV